MNLDTLLQEEINFKSTWLFVMSLAQKNILQALINVFFCQGLNWCTVIKFGLEIIMLISAHQYMKKFYRKFSKLT